MMDKQTLYHGSITIVAHPLVNIGRKDLDFGPGFYLTPLYAQAEQWAMRLKTIYNINPIKRCNHVRLLALE